MRASNIPSYITRGFQKGVSFQIPWSLLSSYRLLASQFSPLLHKLELSIQSWTGKLFYAGRLELIRSILHGMVQFWLSILPIPTLIISKITTLCRNFLWTGNTLRNASALVAWKHVYFPKNEGGLALLDIKAKNRSFLAKQLWNIHIKADSLWIKWVDHYSLHHSSIWNSNLKATSSPL